MFLTMFEYFFSRNQNVSLSDVHVIGHSLGKIIIKFRDGKWNKFFTKCSKINQGRISPVTLEGISTVNSAGEHQISRLHQIVILKSKHPRITGLDPAAPLFTNASSDAIKQSDGKFVDIIHTCAYALGEIWPRGHIDFYPNSGRFHQPGCRKDDLLQLCKFHFHWEHSQTINRTILITISVSCSHFRAPLFYAESILFPYSFAAVKCTFREITGDTPNKCTNSNESIYMGDVTPIEYDLTIRLVCFLGKIYFSILFFFNNFLEWGQSVEKAIFFQE